LLGAFPTAEEYQRIYKEKMEDLHKRPENDLQKIRETAGDIATIESWGKIGERLLNNVVKPVLESYHNPKKPVPADSANNDRRELDKGT
jgi:hypothetical protein